MWWGGESRACRLMANRNARVQISEIVSESVSDLPSKRKVIRNNFGSSISGAEHPHDA